MSGTVPEDGARRLRRPRLLRVAAVVAAVLVALPAALLAWAYLTMIRMPGESYRGPLPPLSGDQEAIRDDLRRVVVMLSETIGGRTIDTPGLALAAEFLAEELGAIGLEARRQEFDVDGRTCVNLIAEVPGVRRPGEIVVVGAHYDSCGDLPAANDNGSGVAAVLALARAFAGRREGPDRTIRFVFFANEEPPHFQTDRMGSLVYARACRARGDAIVAMLSLETMGYYSDEPGSQHYPAPLDRAYPSEGNFIGFVGDIANGPLVREAVGSFRRHARFPSEGGALPGNLPGVGFSDHWSFWQVGYPAIMVTDTAPFRYRYYHTADDTPGKVDFDRLVRVVDGLRGVVEDLAGGMGPAGPVTPRG